MRKFLIFLSLLVTLLIIPIFSSQQVNAQTYVYVTRTGKRYYYNRNDWGLSRAKKVYRISISKAKERGLTLAQNEKNHKTIVKKTTVKNAKKIHKYASKHAGKSTIAKHQIVILNGNRPAFSKAEMSLKRGAWARYGRLDKLNRSTIANAMLNYSLMPKVKREPLYVNPIGWHNKKANGTWLYNRSHLIGYQFTGQNNNLRNLMTGTRSLNDPAMSTFENKVAYYLRSNHHHYVRYQVKPVFQKNNLLASGVIMRAESVGSKAISFNVYIKNIQKGFKINYATGTSVVNR